MYVEETSFCHIIRDVHYCQTFLACLPSAQVWNADFSLKKYVEFGRIIKSALFKVCPIAFYTCYPSFEQFVNTTPVKSSPFAANHFLTSSYESKPCSASAWFIDTNKV